MFSLLLKDLISDFNFISQLTEIKFEILRVAFFFYFFFFFFFKSFYHGWSSGCLEIAETSLAKHLLQGIDQKSIFCPC